MQARKRRWVTGLLILAIIPVLYVLIPVLSALWFIYQFVRYA